MNTRILVYGLNGTGKSTLGAALAQTLGIPFLDIETYFFPKRHDYLQHRTHEEAFMLLRQDMGRLPSFVLASLRGDSAWPLTHAVLLTAPAEVRSARVRMRSEMKFGARMQPGGDLYDSEERFFAKCAARSEEEAIAWRKGTDIPCLALDGTRLTEENVARIGNWLREIGRP